MPLYFNRLLMMELLIVSICWSFALCLILVCYFFCSVSAMITSSYLLTLVTSYFMGELGIRITRGKTDLQSWNDGSPIVLFMHTFNHLVLSQL